MSNFLQRIAASASQRQSEARPRLQPMLGSIFAPTTPLAPTLEAIPIEGIADSAPEVYSESEMSRPAVRNEQLFPSVQRNKFSFASPVPQEFEPHDDGRLLPLEYSGEAFAPRETTLHGAESGQQRVEILKESSRLTRLLFPEWGNRIRMREQAQTRSGRSSRRPRSRPNLREPLRSPLVPRPNRVSAQRSEPDEIHIHIGRIEVAAVAPPPPRAAAPAPRKGINLDEYLRRGSGGQR